MTCSFSPHSTIQIYNCTGAKIPAIAIIAVVHNTQKYTTETHLLNNNIFTVSYQTELTTLLYNNIFTVNYQTEPGGNLNRAKKPNARRITFLA